MILMLMCDSTEELQNMTRNAVASFGDEPLVIVDNASLLNGGFARSVTDIYIRNRENVGYPKAVNQGMRLIDDEIFAIANNDIRVSPNWKNVAMEIFKDETVGSVHFRMIGYDDPIVLGDKTWITGKERWCSASFFVIRKKAFVGYDENYKEGGYDDWDFFHRMRHIDGWRTAYTTKACYQHAHSLTYRTLDDGKSRKDRDERNREHFKSKFGKYAEEIWAEKYPDQMSKDYYTFLKTI